MTEAQFHEFQRLNKQGNVLIGIDMPYAREVYLKLSYKEIYELTGERPYLSKTFIYGAFLATFALLFASIVLSIYAFSWWSLLIIPALVFVHMYNMVAASMKVRMLAPSLLIIVLFVLLVSGIISNSLTSWSAFIFVASLYSAWALKQFPADLLRSMVTRNRLAMNAFSKGVRLIFDSDDSIHSDQNTSRVDALNINETDIYSSPCAQHSPSAISPARVSQTLELAALEESATDSFAENGIQPARSPVRGNNRDDLEIC